MKILMVLLLLIAPASACLQGTPYLWEQEYSGGQVFVGEFTVHAPLEVGSGNIISVSPAVKHRAWINGQLLGDSWGSTFTGKQSYGDNGLELEELLREGGNSVRVEFMEPVSETVSVAVVYSACGASTDVPEFGTLAAATAAGAAAIYLFLQRRKKK